MRYLALILSLLAFPAQAQWLMIPSTPDISVSNASTLDVRFIDRSNNATIPQVDWLSIKNDCSDTLYFALRPPHEAKSALDYPLRLAPGETFTIEARITSIGVSNDNSSACTFTMQGKRR